MKKVLHVWCFLVFCLFISSCGDSEIRVLQFNVWQEGTIIENGFENMVKEIISSDADFVALSEVRNYNDTRFCDRIVEALREKGVQYYSFYSYDSGLLSKTPIDDSTTIYPIQNDHGTIYRLTSRAKGAEFAIYTAHLDYQNCTYYDVRGYDGSTWRERQPLSDLDSVLILNKRSRRDDAIRSFLVQAEEDHRQGRIVILGGDFNEPSHLDWTEATKDIRDHQGLVVPWDVSVMLEEAGFKDAYRVAYPDPVTHPGFTYPADTKDIGVEKLTWAPKADERERIDFIMYRDERLRLLEVSVVGPIGSILRNQRDSTMFEDRIIEPLGSWPSDHKAVLAVFEVR